MTEREALEQSVETMAKDARVFSAWAVVNTVFASLALWSALWVGWMNVAAAVVSAAIASRSIYLHARCRTLLADMGEDET